MEFAECSVPVAANGEPALRGEKLGKRFGRRLVFRDVNFAARRGEVWAVLGRNGAGQSTLLQIVAGLSRPTTGQIRWSEGEDKLREQCGLSAPDAPIYRELTVLENLEFFARARCHYTVEELQAHLSLFELESRSDDLVGALSSGLRARLQLAVATFQKPAILLLDEPSANLDEAGRTILRSTLQRQREHGLALVATNDSRDLDLCDGQIRL